MIQNQYGNIIYISAGTFLTDASEIIVTLTRPHNATTWKLTDNDIAIGTVDLINDEVSFEAYTYVQRTFQEGDIEQSGEYKVNISALIDGKLYKGDTVCFKVAPEIGSCC